MFAEFSLYPVFSSTIWAFHTLVIFALLVVLNLKPYIECVVYSTLDVCDKTVQEEYNLCHAFKWRKGSLFLK